MIAEDAGKYPNRSESWTDRLQHLHIQGPTQSLSFTLMDPWDDQGEKKDQRERYKSVAYHAYLSTL